ncbi:MAG: glycoside hydrolase [Betaproteobacteria bacterium]|nr:glycoside hydrolase [Betaproteobacteria bacterium]
MNTFEREDANALTEECALRSLRLLRENLGPHGFLAAAPTAAARARSYDRVFGRDAALCAIAAARTGDDALVRGAVRSLETLAGHQAENGQIPKFVVPERRHADFWYLGCIDATLWWLIALRLVSTAIGTRALERRLAPNVEAATRWLLCQEHQQIRLLQQNEASDWADIMPRSGFVLYTNALWHYVKRLHGLPRARETREHFNALFFPFSRHVPDYKRLRLLVHYVRNRARNREMYLSYVNLATWGEEGDVFGNVLAVLLGLADDHRSRCILDAVARVQVGAPYPVRVTASPIPEHDRQWRTYMGRHRQNTPHRYHNGGIWPFVGGFWALALARQRRLPEARSVLTGLARANAQGGWSFREWFHGATGAPEGMERQSWNAALFLLARDGIAAIEGASRRRGAGPGVSSAGSS